MEQTLEDSIKDAHSFTMMIKDHPKLLEYLKESPYSINDRVLYGEFGRPVIEDYELNLQDFMTRFLTIDLNCVCLLVKEIEITEQDEIIVTFCLVGPHIEKTFRVLEYDLVSLNPRLVKAINGTITLIAIDLCLKEKKTDTPTVVLVEFPIEDTQGEGLIYQRVFFERCPTFHEFQKFLERKLEEEISKNLENRPFFSGAFSNMEAAFRDNFYTLAENWPSCLTDVGTTYNLTIQVATSNLKFRSHVSFQVLEVNKI